MPPSARRLAVGCLAVGGVAACQTVQSSEVRTRGMFADLKATDSGSGEITVRVALRVGGALSSTHLDLSDGDRLVVTSGKEKLQLTREAGLLGRVHYAAKLPEGSTQVALTLDRDREEGSGVTEIVIPPPFSITSPQGSATMPSVGAIEIRWAPPGDHPMTWRLSGPCIRPVEGQTPDTGSIAIDASMLRPLEDGAGCDVTVSLSREIQRPVHPSFAGGRATGAQVRQVDLTFDRPQRALPR